MKTLPLFVLCSLLFATTVACKSKTEECMERTNKNYDAEVAKCSDDACKKKALEDKMSWYEACKELK